MARDRGFHPVRIVRIIRESADTRTYELDVPLAAPSSVTPEPSPAAAPSPIAPSSLAALSSLAPSSLAAPSALAAAPSPTAPSSLAAPPPLTYRAGQFLTFRICGTLRSYSMSSSPDTDDRLMVTVKRVPGGQVSTWMHDHLAAGDLVEVTAPAGVFCLRESSAPLIAFCGGSGITPIMSLVKSALATTSRRVRVLAANRDTESVIFGPALEELARQYPGRLDIRHHLDVRDGLVTDSRVRAFTGGDRHADFYICGPAPFMDLIERTLLAAGADPGQIFIERFETGAAVPPGPGLGAPPEDSGPKDSAQQGGTVTIVLAGKRHTLPRRDGETVLECARRAGLSTPFSCEAGNCATCIAQITEGEAVMRVNDALDDDEVADGWVLTCQGEPVSQHLTVVFED